MPAYVTKQLLRYKHPHPEKPYSPTPIKYGKNSQDTIPSDTTPRLNKAGKNAYNKLLAASSTTPVPLILLSSWRSWPLLPNKVHSLNKHVIVDYMATHPDAKICYQASDMVFNVHSDASYLSAPNARSCAGGYFFLGSIPQDDSLILINGAIHITCTILKLVAASAAEAELGALFLNTQEAKVLRLVLKELGHPQPPIPIHIDNTTTVGIVNNTIKRQWSRAMKMCYFWLLDAEAQQLFHFYYQPGQESLGTIPPNIILLTSINMFILIMCTWICHPLLSLKQLSLVLGEGVLKH
jgi:hypothetical protein